MHLAAIHGAKGKPGALPPDKEALWQEAMNNPDYKMYPHIYNVLTQKGQHMPPYFQLLIDPYDNEAVVADAEKSFANIKVPDLHRLGLVCLHLQNTPATARRTISRKSPLQKNDVRRSRSP